MANPNAFHDSAFNAFHAFQSTDSGPGPSSTGTGPGPSSTGTGPAGFNSVPGGPGGIGTMPGGFAPFGAMQGGAFGPMPVQSSGFGPMPMQFGTIPLQASGFGAMHPSGFGPTAQGGGSFMQGGGSFMQGGGGFMQGSGGFTQGGSNFGLPQAGSTFGATPFPSNPATSGGRHSRASSHHQVRYSATPGPSRPAPGLVGPGMPGTFEPPLPTTAADQDPPFFPADHYARTFGDALGDRGEEPRWTSPLPRDFMSPNQVSLNTSSLSETLSNFISGNPDLAEPATTSIKTFAQSGGIADDLSNSPYMARAALAGIPYPNPSEDLATSFMPSQAGSSSSALPNAPFQVPSHSSSQAPPHPSSQDPPHLSSQAPPPQAPPSAEMPQLPPKTTINVTDILGQEAVDAAFDALKQCLNARHPGPTKQHRIVEVLVQVTKEWTLGFLISRILGGQLPDQTEILDICNHALDTPEVTVLFAMSKIHAGFPLGVKPGWRDKLGPEVINHFESFVTAPVRTAVVRWHHDFLNAVLFYTLAHVLRNPRMFPDYDDSWPIDTYLKMKTLILAKTGGYMHLYCKRAKSEFVTSFHMLLDSYQHPTGVKAYEMALDIQEHTSDSRFGCHLFQHAAVGSVAGFAAHAMVYSNCAVVASFLVGQNKLVNHQLTRDEQLPGQMYLLVPFCCGILTLALAGIEEFGHQVSVEKILHNSGLMNLLYAKVGHTREFMNFMRSQGTRSEKKDIEWLNKSIKARVAMAIKPFHQDIIGDLGSIVQPTRSARFASQFADLESESDFRRTYVAHQNDQGGPFSEAMNQHVEEAQRLDEERLAQRKVNVEVATRSSAFLFGLGTRTFENVGLRTPREAPPGSHTIALASFQPSLANVLVQAQPALPPGTSLQHNTLQPALPASAGSPMQQYDDGGDLGDSDDDNN